MQQNPVAFIAHKRDGLSHSKAEIQSFIQGFLRGEVADYQVSAWLMAAWLKGLSKEECLALTESMQHSGRSLDLGKVTRPKVDKHSTGGVGDKISLCLGPLVAACGVAVPMVAGRGLGHTGGTLDKLEAIPGFQVHISARRFESIVQKVGVSIMGQTEEIAPADARLYALRDVTATVESIPLIVASILSKKLATEADALVMDVKCGRGAFMQSLEQARELAKLLVQVGTGNGRKMRALITDMSFPLGLTVGNALETQEAIDVLQGKGPKDVVELTFALGKEMLMLAGTAKKAAEAQALLKDALESGRALEVFARMVAAHGGDSHVADRPGLLPKARARVVVLAPSSGHVGAIDTKALGLIGVALGAGRTRVDQKVDPAAGIVLAVQRGDFVKKGEPLGWLHARSVGVASPFVAALTKAITLGRAAPDARKLILEKL